MINGNMKQPLWMMIMVLLLLSTSFTVIESTSSSLCGEDGMLSATAIAQKRQQRDVIRQGKPTRQGSLLRNRIKATTTTTTTPDCGQCASSSSLPDALVSMNSAIVIFDNITANAPKMNNDDLIDHAMEQVNTIYTNGANEMKIQEEKDSDNGVGILKGMTIALFRLLALPQQQQQPQQQPQQPRSKSLAATTKTTNTTMVSGKQTSAIDTLLGLGEIIVYLLDAASGILEIWCPDSKAIDILNTISIVLSTAIEIIYILLSFVGSLLERSMIGNFSLSELQTSYQSSLLQIRESLQDMSCHLENLQCQVNTTMINF